MSLTPDGIGQLCNSLPGELNAFSPTIQILKVIPVRKLPDTERDRYQVRNCVHLYSFASCLHLFLVGYNTTLVN